MPTATLCHVSGSAVMVIPRRNAVIDDVLARLQTLIA